MKLRLQKRLAGDVLKCSEKKVVFDTERLEDIKEAITKMDIRALVGEGAISKKPTKGVSRVRARKTLVQKRKGKRKGAGSKKGKRTARLSKKDSWMKRIRIQRKFLKELKDKELISRKNYRVLIRKSKGGFFRSKRHIKLYLEERKLIEK